VRWRLGVPDLQRRKPTPQDSNGLPWPIAGMVGKDWNLPVLIVTLATAL